MDPSQRSEAADSLLAAYETREAVHRSSRRIRDLTLDDAYGIQQLQLDSRLESGLTVCG